MYDLGLRDKHLFWLVAALLLVGVVYYLAVYGRSPMAFPHDHLTITRADGVVLPFDVEVAATPQQQMFGLMFRKNLPSGKGMLFLWTHQQPISMWMKNTLIPLDMLFIGADGMIVKIAEAKPLDETPIDGPVSLAVIEIGGGEAARQGIKTGDKVQYKAFLPILNRL